MSNEIKKYLTNDEDAKQLLDLIENTGKKGEGLLKHSSLLLCPQSVVILRYLSIFGCTEKRRIEHNLGNLPEFSDAYKTLKIHNQITEDSVESVSLTEDGRFVAETLLKSELLDSLLRYYLF